MSGERKIRMLRLFWKLYFILKKMIRDSILQLKESVVDLEQLSTLYDKSAFARESVLSWSLESRGKRSEIEVAKI